MDQLIKLGYLTELGLFLVFLMGAEQLAHVLVSAGFWLRFH